MSDKLVVIDGNSIFYRSFYALPLLSNSNGEYSNAVYGFAIQVLNIINNIKPKYMVVAFDAGKHTFRNDIYDGYKATRKPMPDELRSQIEPLKNMLKLMNITIVEKLGYEGDDIIGIVSKKFSDIETIIVTGDRDSFQLVDSTTKVYFTKKGTSELKIMGVEELKEEYGVSPELFIDLKALQGDTSDNIPGVAGIGPKTATDLIHKFGDIDGIYANIDNITGKTKEKLIAGKELAYLSKKLATILTHGDIELKIEDCIFDFPFSNEVYKVFKHYEFKSLLKNKNIFSEEEIENANFNENFEVCKILKLNEFDKIIKAISKLKKFAFYYSNDEYHISMGSIEYTFVVTYDLFGESIDLFAFFEKFKPIFESNEILKICYNSKKDMYLLKKYGCELVNYFDCAIAKYLVDGVPVDSVSDILFEEDKTFVASKLYNFALEYKNKIKEENLEFLFYDVEIPLSKVLFSMENDGFKVDKGVMLSLKEKYSSELKMLEKEIFELAGEEFNVNSPKQLAHILYDKLGLPHGKKQSTSAEKLEEISGMHAIVNSVLRYRKVAKFLGTYIDGLANHLDKNDFIHTSFTQTLTTTGRLSSVEPNLQNIPIRSEESREIRSMFVASSENNVLIDADYSQIELR
ncbi:MAG: DNA polymerase I, partial [Clostridia bacterium]|nr:DNA polymerase I [Clostridia bacterium]